MPELVFWVSIWAKLCFEQSSNLGKALLCILGCIWAKLCFDIVEKE